MLYTALTMKSIISATEARNNFFEILNAVIYKGEEFVIEKKDAGTVKIVPDRPKHSPEEVAKVLKEFRKVFAKAAKRKYWSVIDTPAWKKKERKYLENLSKGIIK
jgi:antitoxin (DNA-binding transcriptional repressor) of toxin-antitoxin stability system